jgi:hypothetical protein
MMHPARQAYVEEELQEVRANSSCSSMAIQYSQNFFLESVLSLAATRSHKTYRLTAQTYADGHGGF